MNQSHFEISGYRSEWTQGTLFDPLLGNHGHVRTVIGGLMERLTCRLIEGSRRHKTQARKYCPDISANGVYYESKAAGRSKQTFIYAGRLEKDRAFHAEHPLFYAVWHHLAKTKEASTVGELEALILKHLQWAAVIPFAEFDWICQTLPEEKLNSAYGPRTGNEAKTYGSGFRVPVKSLLKFRVKTWLNLPGDPINVPS